MHINILHSPSLKPAREVRPARDATPRGSVSVEHIYHQGKSVRVQNAMDSYRPDQEWTWSETCIDRGWEFKRPKKQKATRQADAFFADLSFALQSQQNVIRKKVLVNTVYAPPSYTTHSPGFQGCWNLFLAVKKSHDMLHATRPYTSDISVSLVTAYVSLHTPYTYKVLLALRRLWHPSTKAEIYATIHRQVPVRLSSQVDQPQDVIIPTLHYKVDSTKVSCTWGMFLNTGQQAHQPAHFRKKKWLEPLGTGQGPLWPQGGQDVRNIKSNPSGHSE
ncbi:hypothetical protein EMCG_01104 [[Emmonsia] crescens]|uniref:Uncharacterized protein n=1 Tax=[Emmonsia] crescens TaxID=73230 RepID=A0A0G2J619_9EURO|nr:hypothetical protein EMCG_01104 [Emmonsia crescens UAMH 3008]